VSSAALKYQSVLNLEESREELWDLAQIREGLEQVMPTTLVQASEEAAERVSALPDIAESAEGTAHKNLASVLAAALGTIAPAATAAGIAYWLSKESRSRAAFVPRWLRPRIDPECTPKLTTMTSFANDRSRMVREAIEDSTPVLISRHGQIRAALVPLEPGAYEAVVYEAGGRARLAADNAAPLPVELDEKTADAILAASDPAKEAAARGIDTSDWANLNPPD
jgi:hypothetical protein